MTSLELLKEIEAWLCFNTEPSKEETAKLRKSINEHVSEQLRLGAVIESLPSVDEAGVMAVKISEMVEPPLTAQGQAFFIAGFCECVKWLASNDH